MNFAKVMKVTKQRAALDSVGAPRSAHGDEVLLEWTDTSGDGSDDGTQPGDSIDDGFGSPEAPEPDDRLVDDEPDDDSIDGFLTCSTEPCTQEIQYVSPSTYSPDDVARLLLAGSSAPKKVLPRAGARNSALVEKSLKRPNPTEITSPRPLKTKPGLSRGNAVVTAAAVEATIDVEDDGLELVNIELAEADGVAEPMKKGRKDGFRVNNFVFTMFNYSARTLVDLLALVDDGVLKYIGFGLEVCPDTKRKHLQGVAQIGNGAKLIAWSTFAKKTSMFNNCTVLAMRGTIEVARHYCMKGDAKWVKGKGLQNPCSNADFRENGEMVGRGGNKSTDTLHEVMDMLRAGKPVDDLLMMPEYDSIAIKHYKTLVAISARFQPKRIRGAKPIVYWWWGPTGCGKTESVYERWEKKFKIWQSSNSMQWFDGYDGHEVAILDDFRPDQCTFAWLLRILDQYALKVPVKGGFVEWNPKIIVITCPFEIEDCDFKFTFGGAATNKAYDLAQLKRRVTAVKEFSVKVKNEDGLFDNDINVVEID